MIASATRSLSSNTSDLTSPADIRTAAGGTFVRLADPGTMDLIPHALGVFTTLEEYHPAIALGTWSGHCAVIGLDVHAQPTDTFFTPTDDALFFGVHRFPQYPSVAKDTGALSPTWGDSTQRSLWLDYSGQWWLRYSGTQPSENELDVLKALILNAQAPTPTLPPLEWNLPSKQEHTHAVESCLEAIRAGDVYQTCISGFFNASEPHVTLSTEVLEKNARDYFVVKVLETTPAHALYIAGRDAGNSCIITSFSPELYLERVNNTVRSSPIKGTVPSDTSVQELAESHKDRAENIMIVDLVRHDLGQIAATGSVRASSLLDIIPAPGVWHLVSTVTAEVPGVSNSELITATFPPASVTGTPKYSALQHLNTWEKQNRDAHCGAGGFCAGEVLDLAVLIRTMEWTPHQVRLGVGGGVTIDSTPAGEWQEILDKSKALLNAPRV